MMMKYSEVSFRSPSMLIEITHGREGSQHDPYAFTEYTVVCNNGPVVRLHQGLREYCTVAPAGVQQNRCNLMQTVLGPDASFNTFVKHTGITPKQIERWRSKLVSKCQKCGGRPSREVEGYPGETFLLCENGHVMDSDFNRSAIE